MFSPCVDEINLGGGGQPQAPGERAVAPAVVVEAFAGKIVLGGGLRGGIGVEVERNEVGGQVALFQLGGEGEAAGAPGGLGVEDGRTALGEFARDEPAQRLALLGGLFR